MGALFVNAKPKEQAKIALIARSRGWHGHCFFAAKTNSVHGFLGAATLRLIVLVSLASVAFAAPALADPVGNSGDFDRAFAMDGESFGAPISMSTRDENGNRVIVNGRMEIEGTLSGGLMDGFGSGLGGSSAQAVGNQLNVITQGNYNTVIVDSTQINNGDISADVEGDD